MIASGLRKYLSLHCSERGNRTAAVVKVNIKTSYETAQALDSTISLVTVHTVLNYQFSDSTCWTQLSVQ
jgi:hypothetical protein